MNPWKRASLRKQRKAWQYQVDMDTAKLVELGSILSNTGRELYLVAIEYAQAQVVDINTQLGEVTQ